MGEPAAGTLEPAVPARPFAILWTPRRLERLWLQGEQVSFEEAELLCGYFGHRNIDGRRIVFFFCPTIQQFNLMAALYETLQNAVELACGLYRVRFFLEPVLWLAESEFHGLIVEMAKGAGAFRLGTDEPFVFMFQN
ncbi:MAG: hypothetical protein ACOX9C_01955 [Kiritimatiellia bacterium]